MIRRWRIKSNAVSFAARRQRYYETERGFGCISYTKRAANPVFTSIPKLFLTIFPPYFVSH
jgi:hypothetical protein